MTTAASSLTLAHAGFRVRIDVEDRPTRLWLLEFLGPWFQPTTADAEYEIAVRIDPGAMDGTVPRGPGATRATASPFLFDSPVSPLPAVEEGERRSIYDAALGVVYVIRARARCAEIVAPAAGDGLRVALMRAVRELATIRAGRRGALLLHAAVWDSGRGAIVVAGPKGGGKTTLLLHLLEAVGGRFVANDRCLAVVDGARPMVSGMPTIVSIRPPTLALFPELARRLGESGYRHTMTIEESRATTDVGRPDLSPAQLCDLTGVEAVAEGPLGALVFLDAGAPGRSLEIRPLSSESAASRTAAALLGGTSPETTAGVWLGHASGDVTGRDETAGHIARLVACVPCFACRIDHAAPLAAAAVRDLAARLVAGAGVR